MDDLAADRWDAEYRAGRYRNAPPVAFTTDVLAAARAHGTTRGVYAGCGNGRNYLPLVDGGLDLLGVDVSAVAIAQLARARPTVASRLVVGDLLALPSAEPFDLVVALQVLQHGTRAEAHRNVGHACALVAPGGLLAVRVNAVGTEIAHAHEVVESGDDGLTVRYTAGPKAGMAIHFFAAAELAALATAAGLAPLLPPRADVTRRSDGSQWTQWEAIWRRPERGAR